MQAGSPQLKWESDSGSSFTISDADDEEAIDGSGTRLTLHIKDDAMQYLESSKLEELVQRYSEFIEFPLQLWKSTTEYEKVRKKNDVDCLSHCNFLFNNSFFLLNSQNYRYQMWRQMQT